MAGVRGAVLDWLALVRFPNLFTAMADPLAGVLVASSGTVPVGRAFALMLASASLYAAGCVANDIHDRETDRAERPSRPIPAGRVSLAAAWAGASMLMGLGLAAARFAGPDPFLVALALAGCILVYDFFVKEDAIFGPLAMAACRGLNLLFGMSAGAAHGAALAFPLVTVCFILAVTSMSRGETGEGVPAQSPFAAVAAIAALLIPAALLAGGALQATGVPVYVLFASLAAIAFRRGLTARRPAEVGKAVGALILLLPLLDSFYVAAARGLLPAAAVCLLMVPAGFFARRFYVT